MDTLIAEVATVQESLHELKNAVDANLIYFKLEENQFRDDRIQYVIQEIQMEMNQTEKTPLIDLTDVDSEASTSSHHGHSNERVPSPINSLPDFLYDVNNNDPNNNIEYELPQPIEIASAHAQARQHEVRDILLREARTIHCIVPNQNLEQIYSYLEANVDNEKRVQFVMQLFLLMELPLEARALSGKVPGQTNSSNTEFVVKGGQFIEKPVQVTSSVGVSELALNVEPVHTIRSESNQCISVVGPVQVVSDNDRLKLPQKLMHTTSDSSISKLMPVQPLQTIYAPGSSKDMSVKEPMHAIAVPDTSKHMPSQMPSLLGTIEPVHSTVSSADMYESVKDPVQGLPTPGIFNSVPFKEDVQAVILNSTSCQQNAVSKVPINHLRTLQEMFPDIDMDYLNSLVYEDISSWMTNTVSHLLEIDYPRRSVIEKPVPPPLSPNHIEKMIEIHYQNVLAVLPDADPLYLRDKVKDMAGDEHAVKVFVAEALELKNYPTLKDYLKRLEVAALQKRFTEQFSIEDFLEIFPDPFHYFTVEKNVREDSVLYTMWYLKNRYHKIRCADLTMCLSKNKFNLTRTCMELDKWTTFMKSSRYIQRFQGPTDTNIPFLQEVAFIENMQQIRDYIEAKKTAKEAAYKKARETGELMECSCCFHDEVLMEDMRTCSEGHLFCTECVQKGAETQIGEGKTVFPCFVDCGGEFTLKTLQGVLKPAVFSRMLHRKQLEEVKAAGIPGLETCPFCVFATIPASEDKVFHCLNPDCMKDSCRLCLEPNHVPLRCEEVEKSEEIKVRTFIEDRMTEALVRKCWKCDAKFIKEDGCNKMRCTCGALMCYVCRKPVKDYSHFNSQGGQEFHKCPLFTNNVELHVIEVQKEAEKAKAEASSSNPNVLLKHDPTLVLPEASEQLVGMAPVQQMRMHIRELHHAHRPFIGMRRGLNRERRALKRQRDRAAVLLPGSPPPQRRNPENIVVPLS